MTHPDDLPPATPDVWRIEDRDKITQGVGLLAGLLIVAILIFIAQVLGLVGMKNATEDAANRADHVSKQLDQLHADLMKP